MRVRGRSPGSATAVLAVVDDTSTTMRSLGPRSTPTPRQTLVDSVVSTTAQIDARYTLTGSMLYAHPGTWGTGLTIKGQCHQDNIEAPAAVPDWQRAAQRLRHGARGGVEDDDAIAGGDTSTCGAAARPTPRLPDQRPPGRQSHPYRSVGASQ